MKRIFAILLAALFLFNLAGYRLLFNYMQRQADIEMEASLDKQDYNEKELVIIKIPLSLPYMTNQQNFERIDGEITIGGKILKYVKRKISGGNLILLCLPDKTKMRIASAKEEFFKTSTDLAQNNLSKKSGHSKSGVFKNLSIEYDVVTTAYSFSYDDIATTYNSKSNLKFLPSSHHALPDQPPEFIVFI